MRWGIAHWREPLRTTIARPFMTWKYWTTVRPIMVKMDIERKLKLMGPVRGKELARQAHNRIVYRNMVLAWEHWRILMDDFHETYYSGPKYMRSKMQSILKVRREEENAAMLQESLALKREVFLITDKYRFERLPNGASYLPHFKVTVPRWFPLILIIGILRAFRKISKRMMRITGIWVQLAESNYTENLVAFAVLVNTALMCCEHSRSSIIGQLWGPGPNGDRLHVEFQSKLELGYIVLVLFYTFEAAFKIFGLGARRYFSSLTNCFDFLLVLVSMGQLPISVDQWECTSSAARIEDCEKDSSGLASLRVLRLIRVIRSIRRLTLVQEQLAIISGVMSSSYSLFMLLVGFVLMFASLGTQLFFGSLSVLVTDPHSIGFGTQVWVDNAPSMKSTPALPGLPGTVLDIRPNNSIKIWSVQLLTSFSELATDVETIEVCLEDYLCQSHILSILPRSHFASYSQSIVTVVQIMLRSGWTNIFGDCVSGSGYIYPCLYFGAIFFMWTYFLGNICSAVLIVGFSKKFDGEKKKLQMMALKEQRIQALHRKFKDVLVSEYIRRIEDDSTSTEDRSMDSKSKSKAKKYLLDASKITKVLNFANDPLQHDPWNVADDHENSGGIQKLLERSGGNQAVNYAVMDRIVIDDNTSKKRNSGAQLAASDEVEIRKIQESLLKMSNFEREMYLREGLNSLQIGQHLAVTLGVAGTLLKRRLQTLIMQQKESPSAQNAAYFSQQITPLKQRIIEVEQRVEALQHGHQTGMALFVFRPYHPLRIFACNIVHRLWFERFMSVIVIGSCITLWVQRPSMSTQAQTSLDSFNLFFNTLFLIECLLKVLS